MERTKDSLKVQALTEKIGKLVSSYEDQLADFRAEATIQLETLNEQLKQTVEERDLLRTQLEGYTNDVVEEIPEDTES